MCSERCMSGRATLTIVSSSTSISCAVARTSSARPSRRPAAGGAAAGAVVAGSVVGGSVVAGTVAAGTVAAGTVAAEGAAFSGSWTDTAFPLLGLGPGVLGLRLAGGGPDRLGGVGGRPLLAVGGQQRRGEL